MEFEKLKEIFLLVTTECNWNCSHCYLEHNKKMSYEQANEIIKSLGNKYKITLLGGEILTNPEFIKLFPLINQDYLLTNGLALYQFPVLFDQLIENRIRTLSFSYYFDYDEYFCGVPQNIVKSTIVQSAKRKMNITLNTVIANFNYTGIEKMCEEAIELGASVLKFHNYINIGNAEHNSDYLLTQDQIDYFFSELIRLRKKYNNLITLKYHRSFGGCPGTAEETMIANNRLCWAGTEYIVIDSEYNIFSCPFVMHKGLEIGYYRNGKLFKTNGLIEENRRECIAYYYN